MKNIKFRYVYRRGNEIVVKFFAIEDIERGSFHRNYALLMFDHGYKLISRDFWTGLKDKFEKEIYEGDILNSKNDGSNGCDVWDYGDFVYKFVKWSEKHCCFTGVPDLEENSVHNSKYIEVIGNIHENKNLLKG